MLKPFLQKKKIEAGCDEAGRGCLAGPVYAAAVILDKKFSNEILNDSKQLTEKKRNMLRQIIENEALAWAVGIVTHKEIDEINILNASFLAMHRAVDLAKTHRDEYMKKMAEKHPEYLWESNKGYPTKAHRAAISIHGATNIHRRSFKLLPDPVQGKLF